MKLREHFTEIFSYLKGLDFYKPILISVAALSLLLFAFLLGNISYGMSMAFGVLVSSPSDVPGSLRRRTIGVSLSAFMAVFATLVMGVSSEAPIFQMMVLGAGTFIFSMLAVFGFRASLLSFSAMFALLLSLADLPFEYSFLVHAGLIGCGGLWYLMISTTAYLLTPRRETARFLGEILEETSGYLLLRGELLNASESDREHLRKKLYGLHNGLNEKHEKLREILILKRKRSGKSISARKELLMLVELVDILEIGMANPVRYERMDLLFRKDRDKLEILQQWSLQMARRLQSYREALKEQRKCAPDPEIIRLQEAAREAMLQMEAKAENQEAVRIFKRFYHFKEKQCERISGIGRLLGNIQEEESLVRPKGGERFIPAQDYSLSVLKDHLDFGSPIFRHSLRLALVLLAGYLLGNFLELQRGHWIILTSLVIMRPGYALTKKRFKARLIGTLIGGGVAVLIVLLVENTLVYGVLAVICLILGLSMVQNNFKGAAAFITLQVVFIFALVSPNALEVIQWRVLDTIIGAGLAFFGYLLLWPSWQYRNMELSIRKAMKANKAYLMKIRAVSKAGNSALLDYRLARKEAFLAVGDLNAAFQQMTQEPPSKQKDLDWTYRIVSLNQELLSSLASLGSFVRTHKASESSVALEENSEKAVKNLIQAIDGLNEEAVIEENPKRNMKMDSSQKKPQGVPEEHHEKPGAETSVSEKETLGELQEDFMLKDQLKWTLQVSERLLEAVFQK